MYWNIAKIFGSFIIIIFIIITATWFLIAQDTKSNIAIWAKNQKKSNIEINWKNISINGYPINLNIKINEPNILVKYFDGKVIWEPTFITLVLSPIKPKSIKYYSPGLHALNIIYGKAKWSAEIISETFKGEILVKPTRQFNEKIYGEFNNLQLNLPGKEKALEIKQGKFETIVKNSAVVNIKSLNPYKNSFSLSLSAKNIKIIENLLSENIRNNFGNIIDEFSFDLALNGYLNTQAINKLKLIRWRNDGGSLDVNSFFLKWGSVKIQANGTLALDQNLQPIGAFTIQIINAVKLLKSLEKSGALSKTNSILFRVALASLTRKNNGTIKQITDIPITLQNGQINIGPISLLKTPIIVWPEIKP